MYHVDENDLTVLSDPADHWVAMMIDAEIEAAAQS